MAWQVQHLGSLLPIDWEAEGDEWLHHLWDALGDLGSGGAAHSMSTQLAPFRHVELGITRGDLRSRLCVVPSDGGLLLIVSGDEVAEDPDQIAPWIEAALEAGKRVGLRHRDYQWTALVGPDPDAIEADRYTLGAAVWVGPLRLAPGGRLMFEGRPGTGGQLSKTSIVWTEPAIVTGSSRGYSWPVASEVAYRDLHVLCGLLAVAWGQTWIVREGPRSLELGEAVVPERVRMAGLAGAAVENPQRAVPAELPEWVTNAWGRAAADGPVRDALAAHLEGLQLRTRHSSVALIEFVSSIETLARQWWPGRKCPCCPPCSSWIGGGSAFRKALELVLEPEEARALAESYPDRSATAHSSKLHGSELRFGAMTAPIRHWGSNTVLEFEWQRVYRLAEANRRLLERALQGGLPPPELADAVPA